MEGYWEVNMLSPMEKQKSIWGKDERYVEANFKINDSLSNGPEFLVKSI